MKITKIAKTFAFVLTVACLLSSCAAIKKKKCDCPKFSYETEVPVNMKVKQAQTPAKSQINVNYIEPCS